MAADFIVDQIDSAGAADLFVARLKGDGSNWEWGLGTGGEFPDKGGGVAVGPGGEVLVSAFHQGMQHSEGPILLRGPGRRWLFGN